MRRAAVFAEDSRRRTVAVRERGAIADDHAIFARRTQATAAPLARRLGLQAQVVGFEGGVAGHVAELSRQLKALEGTVLVVGHSNTLPELLQALGGPRWPMLCESSYGQAWVLRPSTPGQVLQLRYGAPDPEREGPDCL